MKPLVDKKYIFARKLDGKPIEIDMSTDELKVRYPATRELFYECGVFVSSEPDSHGRDTELTHEIRVTSSRTTKPLIGKPFIKTLLPQRFTGGNTDRYYYAVTY